MINIRVSFKKLESSEKVIFTNGKNKVSGELDTPYIVKCLENKTVIILGSVSSINSEPTDIHLAADKILTNQTDETDYYGDFIILILDDKKIGIYTDPFGQYPVYYFIDDGDLCLINGNDNNPLIHLDIDLEFIHEYIHAGTYLKDRTSLKKIKVLSPGFKYHFTYNDFFSSEYIMDKVISKANKESPYKILKKTIDQKIKGVDKIVLELSGGVESTSIAAALSSYKSSKDINFLSYYDKRSMSSNELFHSRKVARYFNINLDEIELGHCLPFTPFTGNIPFHILPGSCSCLFKQQRYISNLYDSDSLFINGHGGDSIYLAPSPPGIFTEILFQKNLRHAAKTLYGISLQHRTSFLHEITEAIKSNYISKSNPSMFFFESIKNLKRHINPASLFWWQTLSTTISEVIPMLDPVFSGRKVYYPFLSAPIIINAINSGFDQLIYNEYNRYSLRKSVYINSGYRGIWRTDKGDTTHNILEGININYKHIKEFILGGYVAEKKLIDNKITEKALKNLNLGFPEKLPYIVRVYSAETCLKSIIEGKS